MFVCICNGHRDSEIRSAAQAGLTCARKIYRQLGKPAKRGRCLEFATQLVEEVHATAARPLAVNPAPEAQAS